MSNLTRWTSPSMKTLRRDIDEILEDFQTPHDFRRELDRLFDEVESSTSIGRRVTRFFDRVAQATRLAKRGAKLFAPDTKLLTERRDSYVVRVDLPGVQENDIDVRVEGDVLVISGERQVESTGRRDSAERSYASFTRAITLPAAADASRIQADFRSGVLEVRIPKGDRGRARQIPIRRHEGDTRRTITTNIEPRVRAPGSLRDRDRASQMNAS